MTGRTPVVRVLLCGGLGNQLFQYAYGRALALRSGARLVLDAATLFELDHKYQRDFELDAFCLPPEVEVLRSKPTFSHLRRKVAAILNHKRPLARKNYVKEPSIDRFWPDYTQWVAERDVTIFGYWQCERYFADHEAKISEDLRFRTPIHPLYQAIARDMLGSASVAVHVRRAQYDRKLDLSYYLNSLAEVRQKVPGAKFYLFSDDLDWWKANGEKSNDIVLVENQDLPAIEDFKLMTQCRHFIIANSSFSWWASWLGRVYSDGECILPAGKHWSNPDSTSLVSRGL